MSLKPIPVQCHILKNLSYQEVWDFQYLLHNDIKRQKKSKYYNVSSPNFTNHLIFCEHRPVYTLGKSASTDNLLIDDSKLDAQSIELLNINRGGDITFHGPGQLTVYFIVDLEQLYRDVHKYVRNLEEVIIRVLDDYKVVGTRKSDFTGVWVDDNEHSAKICAIGVHLSRWVSMHGIGFNVNTDLDFFNNIIPCGINDSKKSVTSLSKESGTDVPLDEVQRKILIACKAVFGFEYIN